MSIRDELYDAIEELGGSTKMYDQAITDILQVFARHTESRYGELIYQRGDDRCAVADRYRICDNECQKLLDSLEVKDG